ncbi:hypothetical protein CKO15_13290 [Halorhodospira abdelmalekii]|uniref:HD-GYP domain-containing protein n=1 Tax=Halorhodospira abdelmalekii TaxID=421629 RepID=UPI00190725BB|nr:HD domain-containing phosphohydrolase [Halorhodospira abdelmalekii]MBK1736221.1 hypothetical protein [Halorhodospira abdelmalekii]
MARIALLISHRGNHRLLHDYLGSAHTLLTATEVALKQDPPHLVLTDLSGLHQWQTALSEARKAWTPLMIPVLLLVSEHGVRKALAQLGGIVDDLASKPLRSVELTTRIRNLLRLRAISEDLCGRLNDTAEYNNTLEQQIRERTESLQRTLGETVHRLTRASEFKDTDTGNHIRRVCHYSRLLAEHIGCSQTLAERIFETAALHDVGKIAVPDRILLKPGPLNAQEWAIMQQHTVKGERLLADSDSPYLQLGAQVARSHHERYDGGGYPDQLAGSAIPLAARIVQLADVYDALRTPRPYKPGFSHQQALQTICIGDGRTHPEHFDPQVLEAFEARSSAFAEIYAALADPPHSQP